MFTNNRLRNTILLNLSLFVSTLVYANQTVYEWRDSKGELHFSDTPHQGAKQIEIEDAQTYDSSSSKTITQDTKNTSKEIPQEKSSAYSLLEILTPSEESTLRNDTGIIDVMIKVEPELKDSDQFQLIYDDKPYGQPQQQNVFTVSDVYRGSHTLKVQVINASGQIIKSSQEITFYMQRPMVNQNPTVNPNKIPKQAPRVKQIKRR